MRLVVAVLLVAAAAGRAVAQEPTADLAEGIRQIEDGDFAGATITLDRAARRLAAEKRTHELAQAYLHLGVAYLGLGSETSARARFRDALAEAGDLRLDPEQFSPRVIEVFEKARAESPARPAGAAPASPAPPVDAGRSGRSKTPFLLGAAGVAAAGVAVAAGGGGSSSPPSTVPTPNTTDTITGLISGGCGPSDTISHRFVPTTGGTLEARLAWTPQGPVLRLYVSTTRDGSDRIASSSAASNTSAQLTVAVQNREYFAIVEQAGGGPCVSYTLTLSYPH